MKWLSLLVPLFLMVVGCRPPDDSVSGSDGVRNIAPESVTFSAAMSPTGQVVASVREVAELQGWAEGYRSGVEMRLRLEQLFEGSHRVAREALMAAPRSLNRLRPSHADGIRVVESALEVPIVRYREAMPGKLIPQAGFRAPVLGAAGELRNPAGFVEDRDALASGVVVRRLARDGVLVTLVEVLEAVGLAEVTADPAAAVERLKRIGFPVDLIEYFPGDSPVALTAVEITAQWAARLQGGETLDSLREELRAVPFVFKSSRAGLEVVPESGDQEIGLFRTQIGGGYFHGVVPGGIIDVNAQLVAQLPQVDFLMSVPGEMSADFRRLAHAYWGLTRANQLTLTRERLPVSGWAQDNGKAGVVRGKAGLELATLIPRYASVGEVPTEFVPGESFLVDGLQAAGHMVVQSPLLFQGGNLLMVLDAAKQRRVLLLSEATVSRNVALGLTSAEVLKAFATEFGADRCVVMTSVSHHLDFDVSVRNHEGRTVAFVNDAWAASQLILRRGLDALAAGGVLDSLTVERAREDLRGGRERALYELLFGAVHGRYRSGSGYPAELARYFSAAATDAPGPNLKSFLTALDFLGSRVSPLLPPELSTDAEQLILLREAEARAALQREQLRELGWEVVRVPSLPDLGTPVNYLNGIHNRSAYLMPVHGGFYAAVDQAAKEKFEEVLGTEVRLIPIESSACQQLQHGAVHCTAVAYPRLPSLTKPGT